MKLPRKLKKQVIKAFGYGTYKGIKEDYLKLESSIFLNRRAIIIKLNKYGSHYLSGQTLIHTHLI